MRIKTFENFKADNITTKDIIDTIKNNGTIMVSSIKNLPNHDVSKYVVPIEITDDNIIVEIGGELYSTDLRFVDKIQYGL